MTPDEQAIEALAEAMHAYDEVHLFGDCKIPDFYRSEARRVWQRIDRQALRRALLADVREQVQELADTHKAATERQFASGTPYTAAQQNDAMVIAFRLRQVLTLLGGEE